MTIEERIESFSSLGRILRDSLSGIQNEYRSGLEQLINTQHLKNPWFTPENIKMAINAIADELTAENLTRWTDAYPQLRNVYPPMRVAVIMAGNIPLVGFHDFISVLITGNNLLAKTSSKDPDLVLYIKDILCNINPGFKERILITDGTINDFDAVIATGSDNTSRYFQQYFGKHHNIIRKNRNSIAIIDGTESNKELEAFGTDVFSYFGLGCRNVSKIYVPSGYDFSKLIEIWKKYEGLINHSKYANNYDFNKAVFMVNKESFIDTGFLLLKENRGLSSPVAVLYYEYYNPEKNERLLPEEMKTEIQCVIGRGFILFGKAQSPELWDYADGIDTIEFLLKKNIAGIL